MPAGEHYFSAQPAGPAEYRRIPVRLADRTLTITTASGVFSGDRLDGGTAVLLSHVPAPPADGDLLDLGCGWGPVALTLALRSPDATVWAVDVNERALDLVRRNAEELGITGVNAVRPEDVPAGISFRALWSNPPIRIGKHELHGLLDTWLPRIENGHDGHLVVARDLGADSLQRWLHDRYAGRLEVHRVATSKGFRVLRVRA